jgi:hypothetical protein
MNWDHRNVYSPVFQASRGSLHRLVKNPVHKGQQPILMLHLGKPEAFSISRDPRRAGAAGNRGGDVAPVVERLQPDSTRLGKGPSGLSVETIF